MDSELRSVTVDVEQPMGTAMREALLMLETACVASGAKGATVGGVREWLRANYGARLASQFRPEYLFSTRAPSEAPE